MKILNDKVTLVTGAGSGIGRAVALHYAAEGANVIVSDINETSGNDTVLQIKAKGGDAHFVKADTAIASDHEYLVNKTIEIYGGLDIACNNAGISGHLAKTGEYPIESWQQVIDINLSGVFYGLRYQIPAMLIRGGGVIVNVSSILGSVASRFCPAYTASKHAVIGLTKAAALEYANKNIRINSIGPGGIKTPLLVGLADEDRLNSMADNHPINRLGTPEEVAELVGWLSSTKSSFVTASHYIIDGGYTAK